MTNEMFDDIIAFLVKEYQSELPDDIVKEKLEAIREFMVFSRRFLATNRPQQVNTDSDGNTFVRFSSGIVVMLAPPINTDPGAMQGADGKPIAIDPSMTVEQINRLMGAVSVTGNTKKLPGMVDYSDPNYKAETDLTKHKKNTKFDRKDFVNDLLNM